MRTTTYEALDKEIETCREIARQCVAEAQSVAAKVDAFLPDDNDTEAIIGDDISIGKRRAAAAGCNLQALYLRRAAAALTRAAELLEGQK